MIVPICTHHPKADDTCIITPADDASLVRHQSYAAYFQAKMVRRGSHPTSGQVSANLLKRVCDGINTSDEVEPWFREKYNGLCQTPKKTGRVLRKEE